MTHPVQPWIAGGAVLSRPRPGGHSEYRYPLERWWDPSQPFVLWVLLNPASADATKPDRTIDRCVERTQAFGGYGGMRVVNLFAWRDPRPSALQPLGYERAVGNPHNDEFIRSASLAAALTIVGWGGADGVPSSWVDARERVMQGLLENPRCLGLTGGRPRHPKPQNRLQLPVDTPPEPWHGPRGA